MQRFIRSFRLPRFLMLVSLAGLLLIPATAVATPLPADLCENVSGTFDLQAIPIIEDGQLVGFQLFSTDITGSLAGGSMTADVVIEQMTPGGLIDFTSSHFFVGTPLGDFSTDDKGVVTPSGQVNDHLVIVDGASGLLTFHGSVDLATGVASGPYHGRVCA